MKIAKVETKKLVRHVNDSFGVFMRRCTIRYTSLIKQVKKKFI